MFSLGAVLVCSILVASTIHMAASNPNGAPKEACDHLKPRHRGGVAQGQTPKTISLTITSTNSPNGTVANYTPGELYTVRLSSTNGVCKGFLVVARYNAQQLLNVVEAGFQEPKGSNPHYRLSDCYPRSAGVTHTNSNTTTSSVEFMWKAPSAEVGPIQFRFTCVMFYHFYYENIEGPSIWPDSMAPTGVTVATYPPTTQPPSSITRPTTSGIIHVQMSSMLMPLLAAVTAAILYMVH